MPQEQYNDQEISEIIRRAAEIEGQGQLDRAILERTAEEFGISPEAIRQAEEELRQNRETEVDRLEYLRYKKQEFVEHLVSFLAVNAFLFFIDFRKDQSLSWFWFPFLGWGIGIALHLASLYRPFSNPEMDKDFRKWAKARKRKVKGKQA